MRMQSSIHLARPVFALCVAFSLLLPCVAQAQDPTREVLPEQKQARAFVSPTGLARLGSRMLFTAFHVDTGQELWSTDGTTAGTFLVKDIHPGFRGAFPTWQTRFGPHVYFTATDGDSGLELWRSDGTAKGTQRVADLNPGRADALPSELTVWRDALYFVANDGSHGFQLWKTQGDAQSTRRVSSVDAGPGTVVRQLTAAGRRLFFTATSRFQRHTWNTRKPSITVVMSIVPVTAMP